MCGIAGFINPNAQSYDRLMRDAKAMGTSLAHRGPDASGEWVDEEYGVAFAHRRLAIIDVTPAGAQPMVSASGRFVLCYNGEVYNASEIKSTIAERLSAEGVSLRGHSDTEIILEAFERLGVKRTCETLIGMFSFALWDRKEKRLWLARDRLGIKPLYFGSFPTSYGPAFAFGSELKSLTSKRDIELSIDRDALAAYVRFSYIPAPKTVYKRVEKLTPGTILQVDASGRIIGRDTFWSLQEVAKRGLSEPFTGSDTDATNLLEQLLTDAIERRMISDVPLGAFLSGGIDSSTVVALMQKLSDRPVRSYSIGFENADFDESRHARKIAAHLGTEHCELRVTAQQARDVIPDLASVFDEPFADSSQIPTVLLSRLTRQHVTVALSGDGGDELFAGYNRYVHAAAMARKMEKAPVGLLQLAKNALGAPSPQTWDSLIRIVPAAYRPVQAGDKIQKFASILGEQGDGIYRRLVSHWTDPEAIVVEAKEPRGLIWDDRLPDRVPFFVDRMRLLDMLTYLPDDILTKVDRASMSVGLEARVPLLDHRVVEFAWQLPKDMLIRQGVGKQLLRRLLYRHVPPALVDRQKMGFGVPLGDWLRGPLKDWAENLLSDTCFARHRLLQPQPVQYLWREHLSGRRNGQHKLWSVLMLHAWAEAQDTG